MVGPSGSDSANCLLFQGGPPPRPVSSMLLLSVHFIETVLYALRLVRCRSLSTNVLIFPF